MHHGCRPMTVQSKSHRCPCHFLHSYCCATACIRACETSRTRYWSTLLSLQKRATLREDLPYFTASVHDSFVLHGLALFRHSLSCDRSLHASHYLCEICQTRRSSQERLLCQQGMPPNCDSQLSLVPQFWGSHIVSSADDEANAFRPSRACHMLVAHHLLIGAASCYIACGIATRSIRLPGILRWQQRSVNT